MTVPGDVVEATLMKSQTAYNIALSVFLRVDFPTYLSDELHIGNRYLSPETGHAESSKAA